MKILFRKIIAIAFLTILIVSCKKQLDTKPDTFNSDYISFEDIKSAHKGVYDAFQSAAYYQNAAASGSASGWSQLPDLMGDDFIEALESLGNWNGMSDYIFTNSSGPVVGVYAAPYEVIFRANKTMQGLVPYETGSTLREAKNIRAQLLAVRAMAHFDAMRYFAPDYGRNSASLGVPYMSVAPELPLSTKPRRATVKENYDAIFADLQESLVNYRLGGNTANNASRFFVDSTVTYAIRARVAYYAQDWAEVIRCTNISLTLRPVSAATDFIASFATTSEATPPSEVYWAIAKDVAAGVIMNPGGATNGPSPNYRITNAMRDTIQKLNTVFGLNAYSNTGIVRFNVSGTGGILRTLSYKYNGQRTFKVFRAGEMLLMRAEAKAKSGDEPGGLVDLNRLRTNRGAVVIPGVETGANLLNAIATLRRVELLSQGHRWFDIKRGNRTIVRAECGISGGSRATTCNVAPTAREWAFPMPFNEMKLNENLVQNTGW